MEENLRAAARLMLDGEWRLAYWREGERPITNPGELDAAGVDTISAHVPGNVELDLQAAGILPEPFYADNIRKLRPYEFYEWWYSRDFDLPSGPPAQRWQLVFAGLDTIATIWVNGVEVGKTANMLVEQRIDVTAVLHAGANRIDVRHRLAAQLRTAFCLRCCRHRPRAPRRTALRPQGRAYGRLGHYAACHYRRHLAFGLAGVTAACCH